MAPSLDDRVAAIEQWKADVVDPWLSMSSRFHSRWEPVLEDMNAIAQVGRAIRRWSVRIVAVMVAVSAIASPWIDLAIRASGK